MKNNKNNTKSEQFQNLIEKSQTQGTKYVNLKIYTYNELQFIVTIVRVL